MRVHQVRRLPVVDDAGRLVGLLSLADICRARTRSPLGRVAEGVIGDLAVTLAAIGRTHVEAASAEESLLKKGPDLIEAHDLPISRERIAAQSALHVRPALLRESSSPLRSGR